MRLNDPEAVVTIASWALEDAGDGRTMADLMAALAVAPVQALWR